MNRLLVLLVVAACGAPGLYRAPKREPNYYSINADGSRSDKYSRINQWSSFGTHGLGAQSAVAAAYEAAQHAPAPATAIDIFNASLPPGVTLESGTVKIAKDAPYEAIGRFELGYWKSSAPRETEIEEDLRRLATVAHGDTLVVEVSLFDHADDRVQYVAGLVLRKRRDVAAPSAGPKPAVERSRAQARLVYKASGGGCMNEAEFADEISAKLGYSPWQANATQTLRADIGRSETGYRATITIAGAEPKQLTGATCRTLLDAVVTVVVIQLDGAPKRFD